MHAQLTQSKQFSDLSCLVCRHFIQQAQNYGTWPDSVDSVTVMHMSFCTAGTCGLLAYETQLYHHLRSSGVTYSWQIIIARLRGPQGHFPG